VSTQYKKKTGSKNRGRRKHRLKLRRQESADGFLQGERRTKEKKPEVLAPGGAGGGSLEKQRKGGRLLDIVKHRREKKGVHDVEEKKKGGGKECVPGFHARISWD